MGTQSASRLPGWRVAGAALLLPLLIACSQITPTGRSHSVSLQPGDLEAHGLALLTPSTITGKEEDRQSLALFFAGLLQEKRPKIRVVPLAETVGAVNRNGLAEEYKRMFEDYRYTGVFDRDILHKVAGATGVRYLAQPKMADFRQDADSRLSFFGLRVIKTQVGNIRLFLTVWDSRDGSIAWEGMQELNYAYDTFRERPISFKQSVDEAMGELISRLP